MNLFFNQLIYQLHQQHHAHENSESDMSCADIHCTAPSATKTDPQIASFTMVAGQSDIIMSRIYPVIFL